VGVGVGVALEPPPSKILDPGLSFAKRWTETLDEGQKKSTRKTLKRTGTDKVTALVNHKMIQWHATLMVLKSR
jgi:hypothetical protein